MNMINDYNLYQKKFIHYKYLLDKTYKKIKNKISNDPDLKEIQYLVTRLELLLLLVNSYYLMLKD